MTHGLIAEATIDVSESSLILSVLFGHNNNAQIRARTSGVLLVVGMGSYLMYRLSSRYFGSNFVYALFERTPWDVLARADLRLLQQPLVVPSPSSRTGNAVCNKSDEQEEDEEDDGCSSVMADDEDSETPSLDTRQTFLSPDGSPIKLQRQLQHQLASTPSQVQRQRVPQMVGRKAGGLLDDQKSERKSISSAITSPQLQRRQHHRLQQGAGLEQLLTNWSSRRSSTVGPASDCSASLRLVWDEEAHWDDEFQQPSTSTGIIHRHQATSSPVPSEVSDMSAAIRLRSFLDQPEAEPSDLVGYDQLVSDIANEMNAMNDEISELMQRSHCMDDPKGLYRSVIVAGSDLDAMSVCSLRSAASLGFFGFKRNNAASPARKSKGLLDLCPQKPPLPQQKIAEASPSPDTPETAMTTSVSNSSKLSKSQHGSTLHRSMMDSAIGTDILSSEDETQIVNQRFKSMNSSGLGLINESPSRVLMDNDHLSVKSLEWCYDDYGDPIGEDDNVDGNEEGKTMVIRLPDLSMVDIDAGFKCTLNGSKINRSSSSSIPPSNHDHEHEPISSSPQIPAESRQNRGRISSTRDLMVFARENFGGNVHVLKVINQLYNRNRLRRISRIPSNDCGRNCAENTVRAVLHALIYHNCPVFRCRSFAVVEETLDLALKGCGFLRQWPCSLQESRDHDNDDGNTKTEGGGQWQLRCHLQNRLRRLWDLEHSSSLLDERHFDSPTIEGAFLLMVLRSFDALQSTIENRTPSRPFYSLLFAQLNPREIMRRLLDGEFDEMELALLADTVNVHMEVYDCRTLSPSSLTTNAPNIATVFPDKSGHSKSSPTLSLLRTDIVDGAFLPLYRVS